jgi:hypothetical protein
MKQPGLAVVITNYSTLRCGFLDVTIIRSVISFMREHVISEKPFATIVPVVVLLCFVLPSNPHFFHPSPCRFAIYGSSDLSSDIL